MYQSSQRKTLYALNLCTLWKDLILLRPWMYHFHLRDSMHHCGNNSPEQPAYFPADKVKLMGKNKGQAVLFHLCLNCALWTVASPRVEIFTTLSSSAHTVWSVFTLRYWLKAGLTEVLPKVYNGVLSLETQGVFLCMCVCVSVCNCPLDYLEVTKYTFRVSESAGTDLHWSYSYKRIRFDSA